MRTSQILFETKFPDYDEVVQKVIQEYADKLVEQARNLEPIPCPIDPKIYFKHMFKFRSKFWPEFTPNLLSNLVQNLLQEKVQKI